MTDSRDNSDAAKPDYDKILDDLYSLQKNLLPADSANERVELSEQPSDEDMDSLEIPILTESLDQQIDTEHQARKVFDEAQHHLFDSAGGEPTLDEAKINAIVSKLMTGMRPKMEQLLREKIRAKVIARFNREN